MQPVFDMQDIGAFNPADMDVLRKAFHTLSVDHAIGDDEALGQTLAKSLLLLYRHGVRDVDGLVSALAGSKAA